MLEMPPGVMLLRDQERLRNRKRSMSAGIAILEAATDEQVPVLVAMMECYKLAPNRGLMLDYDSGRDTQGAWAAATYTLENWAKADVATYGPTRDAAILALRDALRARKEGGADADVPAL